MFLQAHQSATLRSMLSLSRAVIALTCISALIIALLSSESTQRDAAHAASKIPRVPMQVATAKVTVAKKVAVAPHKRAATSLLPVVDQPDILMHHRILADKVLRALPSFCRANLKNFYVNYDTNAANRGLGGAQTIIVIDAPDAEFQSLIKHECGHVTDLGGLRGTVASGQSNFFDGNTPIFNDDPSVAFYEISWINPTTMKSGMDERHFVSGYAMTNPFEDFGETYAFFAMQQEEFARLAQANPVLQAKYEFMERVVFRDTPSFTTGFYVRGNKIDWDVTKMLWMWKAGE
jgi:hypothetical protein